MKIQFLIVFKSRLVFLLICLHFPLLPYICEESNFSQNEMWAFPLFSWDETPGQLISKVPSTHFLVGKKAIMYTANGIVYCFCCCSDEQTSSSCLFITTKFMSCICIVIRINKKKKKEEEEEVERNKGIWDIHWTRLGKPEKNRGFWLAELPRCAKAWAVSGVELIEEPCTKKGQYFNA